VKITGVIFKHKDHLLYKSYITKQHKVSILMSKHDSVVLIYTLILTELLKKLVTQHTPEPVYKWWCLL